MFVAKVVIVNRKMQKKWQSSSNMAINQILSRKFNHPSTSLATHSFLQKFGNFFFPSLHAIENLQKSHQFFNSHFHEISPMKKRLLLSYVLRNPLTKLSNNFSSGIYSKLIKLHMHKNNLRCEMYIRGMGRKLPQAPLLGMSTT